MLSKKMLDALNDQLNFEMFSANIYLSMAAHLEAENLPGFASWMKVQVLEETFHAMKFFGYVNDRRGRVVISALEAPPTQWDSVLAVFENALHHEELVTGRINDLVALGIEQKDRATETFLQWYVTEQVEEEASVDAVIGQLKLAEGSPQALLMLDRELGQRTFTPPPAEE